MNFNDEYPKYKITIDDIENAGMDLISLVANPAIVLKGLAFSKDEEVIFKREEYAGKAILPPCHDHCKCELTYTGKWIVDYAEDDSGPCDFCLVQKTIFENEYNRGKWERDEFFHEMKFNEEQQVIAGPAIIPDFEIYRYDKDLGEFAVVFEKETIKKMVEKFNKNPKKDQINLDHTKQMAPAFINGSWIIESENDKSKFYGFENLPIGTWFIEVKVTDPEFWRKEVKEKGKFGFSIEGLMGLKLNEVYKNSLSNDEKVMKFMSYDDYPQAASDNAERALRIRDEHPELSCGTRVGWVRANQLAKRQPISEETIARMSSFSRHLENSKGNPTEDCGALMWLAWGGTEGIEWAGRKLEQIRKDIQDYEAINMDKTINKQINNNIQEKMKKRMKFAEYTLQDGTKISVEGELAVGSPVFFVLEDGTLEQASPAEYVLEDGTTIFVDEEGLINEVRSAETSAVAEGEVEASEEEVVKEEVKAQVTPEEVMAVVQPMFDEMKSIIAELATRVETLESHEVQPVAVDEIPVEMSRQMKLSALIEKFSK